jgi:hypothetical protein
MAQRVQLVQQGPPDLLVWMVIDTIPNPYLHYQ